MPGLPTLLPFNQRLGETIPPDTPHVGKVEYTLLLYRSANTLQAVSVSLPTWASNVGYEKGEDWVCKKMQCGYPRFFIHPSIDRLARSIVERHGSVEAEKAMLFPSAKCAARCVEFLLQQNPGTDRTAIRSIDFVPHPEKLPADASKRVLPRLSAVIYPQELWPTAKVFWQHTGEGIQSRRAEFCQRAFDDGSMVERSTPKGSPPRLMKGPKRYQRPVTIDHGHSNGATHVDGSAEGEINTNGAGVHDSAQFVEERFGRNMDVAFAAQAKLAIRKRIAGSLTSSHELPESLEQPPNQDKDRARDVSGFSVDDVYIFSCGMNAIFTAYRAMHVARGEMKSIMYGFPYVDTLKILEKFGPGALFYGHCSASDLDDLERRLDSGERYLALFCEFPGNPLLKSPDLKRIRSLADKYDFGVIIDETIGNWLNVHVLPYADVVVSSLTKIFSGDSNVMGGSMILNPRSKYYDRLKYVLETEYEDNQFEEDSVYLERNSRDFIGRVQRVNHNAEAIADTLRAHPKVKQVNYPKYSESRANYEVCRLPDGGYGGLLSATFYNLEDAEAFYDHLSTEKGPSLGTNFTLSSPFVILAHFNELEWAAQYGCEASLVRFSVGLEDTDALRQAFERALDAIDQ